MDKKEGEKGAFIVIEGIDGAGTTTQTSKLAARLRSEGRTVFATREPSDGAIGKLIRRVLTGDETVGEARAASGDRTAQWSAMALLFAADRVDHVAREIEPALARGEIVISDRYDASSIGYQSLTSGGNAEAARDWIRLLNQRALRPGLTIVISVAAEIAERRRRFRAGPPELYEKRDVQRALALFYSELPKHMPGDRIVIIDGAASATEVHERVYAAVAAVMKG